MSFFKLVKYHQRLQNYFDNLGAWSLSYVNHADGFTPSPMPLLCYCLVDERHVISVWGRRAFFGTEV